jgi:hypothetical protein
MQAGYKSNRIVQSSGPLNMPTADLIQISSTVELFFSLPSFVTQNFGEEPGGLMLQIPNLVNTRQHCNEIIV